MANRADFHWWRTRVPLVHPARPKLPYNNHSTFSHYNFSFSDYNNQNLNHSHLNYRRNQQHQSQAQQQPLQQLPPQPQSTTQHNHNDYHVFNCYHHTCNLSQVFNFVQNDSGSQKSSSPYGENMLLVMFRIPNPSFPFLLSLAVDSTIP